MDDNLPHKNQKKRGHTTVGRNKNRTHTRYVALNSLTKTKSRRNNNMASNKSRRPPATAQATSKSFMQAALGLYSLFSSPPPSSSKNLMQRCRHTNREPTDSSPTYLDRRPATKYEQARGTQVPPKPIQPTTIR